MPDKLEKMLVDYTKLLNENRILRREIDRLNQKEPKMKSKTERIVDTIFYICMIFSCGLFCGYAWCWMALN